MSRGSSLVSSFLVLSLSLLGPAGSVGARPSDGASDRWMLPSVDRDGFRIALGSCVHQDKPKPVLSVAADFDPELFVFLGDNIYGDSLDVGVLIDKYERFGSSIELRRLRDTVPVVATWDDHDYGWNDAGREYPTKAKSKEAFLDFWGEPLASPRREHDGIYTSYEWQDEGRTLQLILLDTRWFRDRLDRVTDRVKYKNDYQPTLDARRTLLGAEQWAWLESELQKPADVRIIGTSTQFGHVYNGYESWTNMPLERQRMIDLIARTRAERIVFISGDVHWGELSKLDVDGGYPLYDLTSSGITETWPRIEPNANRVGEPVAVNNFGVVDIDWNERGGLVTFELIDASATVRLHHEVLLSDLTFPRSAVEAARR